MGNLNVLSLDGGGMRGLYSATVLKVLGERFAKLQQSGPFDIGKGFDLVVGTSTGAILAAGIAAGVPINEIANLYEKIGPRIFPRPMPPGPVSLRWRDKSTFPDMGCPSSPPLGGEQRGTGVRSPRHLRYDDAGPDLRTPRHS